MSCEITYGRTLGRGSYSYVREAVLNQETLAVKCALPCKSKADFSHRQSGVEHGYDLSRRVEGESVLRGLQRPSELSGAALYPLFDCTAREYMGEQIEPGKRGTRRAIMQQRGGDELLDYSKNVFNILFSIASALEKNIGLQHLDIKPENIGIFRDQEGLNFVKAVLFDFDGSRLRDGKSWIQGTTLHSSPLYFPPEFERSSTIHPSYDLYSLGVTAYDLLVASPFILPEHKEIMIFSFPEIDKYFKDIGLASTIKNLIAGAIQPHPASRMSISKFLSTLENASA